MYECIDLCVHVCISICLFVAFNCVYLPIYKILIYLYIYRCAVSRGPSMDEAHPYVFVCMTIFI